MAGSPVLAVGGQTVFVVAELAYPASPDTGDILFGVGPLVTASGRIVAGVAVLRARLWRGWSRLLPLLVGGWLLIPMIPVLIATGGPPDPIALLTIIAWDALRCAAAVAVMVRGRASAPPVETVGATVPRT